MLKVYVFHLYNITLEIFESFHHEITNIVERNY